MGAYLISFNVVETIAVGKIFRDGTLAASRRTSDDENVVVTCYRHAGWCSATQ
jgi:hypothetical protein